MDKIICSQQGQLHSKKKGNVGKIGRGIKGVKGRLSCETLQKTILMINMQKVRGSGGERGKVHTGTEGKNGCFEGLLQA